MNQEQEHTNINGRTIGEEPPSGKGAQATALIVAGAESATTAALPKSAEGGAHTPCAQATSPLGVAVQLGTAPEADQQTPAAPAEMSVTLSGNELYAPGAGGNSAGASSA